LENAAMVSGLEQALGATLDFPAPYPRMGGIADRRGIIRSRALWGLYLAWRAKQAGAHTVLELGGGLGYAAYYAALLGIPDYTIVDIPLTLVASGHFLGLTAGEDKVVLYGEEDDGSRPFRLLPPQAFPAEKKFDMVVNMDSFPEFGLAIAREYVEKIKRTTKRFLSINHECEQYTVRELFRDDPDLVSSSRNPFWLRKGYVEEMYEFR
ncbi:MAG: putative sugar O-methyltransferase, partial [Desulfovibrio sp.]|nr:putative sugar O-methyltransferase [Desulfovibrio sp.]